MNGEYMDDCVHLHACRRICKISDRQITRGCNEKCSAYQTMEELANENGYYTHEQVQYAINRAAEDGQRGYGYGDNIVEDYL